MEHLSANNLVLQGSILKNYSEAIGLVISDSQ